ncbi:MULTISPECIES: Na(+)-translocating NADH-quinone reductase subunit A [Reinekea]|uniref:Na(+)-translocating NADH-quinone reductase subunit A n=1 Tax=Reinekea forsetii TaxID=1336806 RepID=A0A2K8KQ28_9GAMM|nr:MULTISPECIES: Na(+)-translocating NADH-quinone reductase subunit A [Reinekea]ATX76867.1 Na(+)-translocating NADH-quinone reductase subunit A [Reinekea forsetii]MDO7643709.1 Na(+)-translocating NADH-quinone reductase subunit A [Reinekea forsetii]
MITIKKGLNLPISGAPRQEISEGRSVRSVALVGYDYHGMKPTMLVREGDSVKKGQAVFSDKKNPGVLFTAPASGVVAKINRGARRVFQSIVIDVQGDEQVSFKQYSAAELVALPVADLVGQLVESGLWTAFRTRPYSKAPAIDAQPSAIFVQAMDTNPLAVDPVVVIAEQSEAFALGLTLLTKLTAGKVWLCKAAGAKIPSAEGVTVEEFSGVHPAGNPGTHIHFLAPVSVKRTVWTIGYQDVIAIAKLFSTGQLDTSRVIAIAGPQVKEPRLIRTLLGASLAELAQDELKPGENRLISGSVFGGHAGLSVTEFLGRYHTQLSVLENDYSRPMVHFLRLGTHMYSVKNTYVSSLFKNKLFDFTTSTNGSERSMLPIGQYEKIMPLDILPTQLLRALVCGDLESAEQLGVLELDEDDLALCTYVCAGKYEYGPILRDTLTKIELEG